MSNKSSQFAEQAKVEKKRKQQDKTKIKICLENTKNMKENTYDLWKVYLESHVMTVISKINALSSTIIEASAFSNFLSFSNYEMT